MKKSFFFSLTNKKRKMEQHNSDGITIAISAGSSSAPTTEMKEEENFLMPPPLPNTTPPPPISTYSVPFWDAKPIHKFQLEVLKTGSIVETRDIYNKGHFLFGRLPHCDIQLEHQVEIGFFFLPNTQVSKVYFETTCYLAAP